MGQSHQLSQQERQVLLSIPSLFPDGDFDDLKLPGVSDEALSYTIQHLIGLRLVTATSHEGVHPWAPYYRDVELTSEGEELRRHLARSRIARLFEREWKWLVSTLIASIALLLSLWNFFNQR